MSTDSTYSQLFDDKTFDCLIPDQALSACEQFVVGVATAGAFRGVFRPATISFGNSNVILRAQTDALVGGSHVMLADLPIKDISEIRTSPISFKSQIKAILLQSLVVGIGLALALIIVIAKSPHPRSFDLATSIVFAILGGLFLGFLCSFLPSVMKAERNLTLLLLLTQEAKIALLLVLTPAQKETAFGVLKSQKFNISEIETHTSPITFEPPRNPLLMVFGMSIFFVGLTLFVYYWQFFNVPIQTEFERRVHGDNGIDTVGLMHYKHRAMIITGIATIGGITCSLISQHTGRKS